MDHDQNSSLRTTLSLFASTALHGATIAVIALGPTFIPGLQGDGDQPYNEGGESSTVEFSVDNSDSSAAVATTPAPAPVAPAPIVEAPVVVTPPPAPKPVVAKKAKVQTPKPVVAKSTLPEKAETVEAQEAIPVIAAAETVEPAEVTQAEEVLTKTPTAEAEEVAQEKQDQVAQENIEDPLDQPLQITQIPNEPVSTPVEGIAATSPAVGSANNGAAPAGAAEAGSATASAAAAAAGAGTGAGPSSAQNYLGLRQLPGNKPPRYSDEMRLKGFQGRGQLKYYVTKEGRVQDIKLAQSTGNVALDKAALESFSKYKFVPGQEGYTVHDFEFSLKGPAESANARLRTSVSQSK